MVLRVSFAWDSMSFCISPILLQRYYEIPLLMGEYTNVFFKSK